MARDIAYSNNRELAAYDLLAKESEALIKSAFNIEKTSIYYNYDENNVADNNYPIGVIGGQQRFDFPSVYFAQKRTKTLEYEMAKDIFEVKKRELDREVSQAYYRIAYLQERQGSYAIIDSVYARFSDLAELDYKKGNSSYLDLLNARSEHYKVKLVLQQLQLDLEIAKQKLAVVMQYDSAFVLPKFKMEVLEVQESDADSDPAYRYLQHSIEQKESLLKVNKQALLPDISIGYFNGTNRYAGSRNYQGIEVGLGIPLFFGEQRAKIKAGKFAAEAELNMQLNYQLQYESKIKNLKSELEKYAKTIDYYKNIGEDLSSELFRSAERSFELKEINFYDLVQSVENAIEIELSYLENLYKYNNIVLEINYMTL
jgi:cobalt-zinc-cadmium resistance protein CzcA